MPRVRLGVVLLVPTPLDLEIDGLRRALDDSHHGQVPPHLTLVPPVNVRTDALPDALRVLRDAAAAMAGAAPLELVLGPPASFRPATDTLFLEVSGSEAAVSSLMRLRDAVFVPPLERPLEWPFVPHVTLSEGIDLERIDGAVSVLAGYAVTASFERVHLLEEQRNAEGHRTWVPIADAPFARPAVVGRGGIEIELSTSLLVDPEVAAFAAAIEPEQPPPSAPAGAAPLVVTPRRRGEVVGVARGWVRDDDREIEWVVVDDQLRGQGIARQLALAFAASG
jgi:2'-5' RNA ligase